MKKDLLLILSIYEGRDLKPENGLSVIIEVKLASHSSSTDPIPLSSCPKFNSEITWQVSKDTIRSYKIDRVPIKLECFSVNADKKKLLGYIILPLNSAVEGVESDAKWHKLLGTSSEVRKSSPSILLGLNLSSMTLDKKNAVNDGQIRMNSNKTPYVNNPALLNGRGFPRSTAVTNSLPLITNGEKAQAHINNPPHLSKKINNPYFNGANKAVGIQYTNHSTKDEEEIAILSDDGENDDYMSDEEDELDDDLYREIYGHGGSFPLQHAESPVASLPQANAQEIPELSSKLREPAKTSMPKTESPKSDSHSDLLKNRETARQHLRRHSKEMFELKFLSPTQNNVNLEAREGCSFEKRVLDSSNPSDSSLHKSKSRKVNSPSKDKDLADAYTPDSPLDGSNVLSNSNDPLHIPLQRSKRPQEKLIAHLDEVEGIFHFGYPSCGNEGIFKYSISIYGAKNLNHVIPESIACNGDGFNFCFSILGCPINTEIFYELDEPKFIVEKASAQIRTTKEMLSMYFMQHSFLPIYLLSGETTLATCSVDLSKLYGISSEKISVDSSYKLLSMIHNSSETTSHITDSLVSICVELEGCPQIECSPHKEISDHNKNTRKKDTESLSRRLKSGSSSDSSFSDLDEHSKSFARLLRRQKRRPSHRKSHERSKFPRHLKDDLEEELLHYKNRLLEEAVQDIKEWKEAEKKKFSSELSMQEALLQKRIASELSTKVKATDKELQEKLRDCDLLHQRMLSTMNDLRIREQDISEREKKIEQEEMELKKENIRLQSFESRHISDPAFEARLREHLSSEQLKANKKRETELEKQVAKLQDDLRRINELFGQQSREILNLQKRLLQSDDVTNLRMTVESLKEQFAKVLERKEYYKSQWNVSLQDLYKLHCAHKQNIERVRCDIRESSPEPSPSCHSRRSEVEYSIRRLKDEKEILLNSGKYAPNHPLLRTIDEKLNTLRGFSEK